MSDIPILPSDTGELMVCAPSQAFFQSEQGVDATSTLGRYDYPTDFNLVQAPGSTSWAYQSVETGKPLHVFLLGEVHSMGATQGEAVQSVKVKCLAAPCKHTAVRFAKDVQVLRDVVRSETSERTVISRSWVEEGDDRQKNVFINVDCGPYTKILNGPLSTGTSVVMDVTLHRQDMELGPVTVRMYSIVAHEVEFVGRFHLLTAGVVERLDPSMSTFEEQLKVMGYIMKETALED